MSWRRCWKLAKLFVLSIFIAMFPAWYLLSLSTVPVLFGGIPCSYSSWQQQVALFIFYIEDLSTRILGSDFYVGLFVSLVFLFAHLPLLMWLERYRKFKENEALWLVLYCGVWVAAFVLLLLDGVDHDWLITCRELDL